MKKFLILLLVVAAIYPYAGDYYRKHFVNVTKNESKKLNINELTKKLNEKLPRQQGFLSYEHVVVSTGSVIFFMTDSMGTGEQLTKNDARQRLNTWRPFLVDYTCRDPSLSTALDNGIINNVYFQFTAQGANVDYGKIIVTPEMC